MPLDLAADLERIALHIPHAAVRAAAGVELAVWRLAKALAELDRERSGHSRTVPERDGTERNDSEHLETEATP